MIESVSHHARTEKDTHRMDPHDPLNKPTGSALRDSLVLKREPVRRGAGSSTTSASGSESGGTGSTGSSTEDAAAGLGVDEFVDPNAGVDGDRHADMRFVPGSSLNLLDMLELREQNHLAVREAALRSGDRRAVLLDSAGLEILQQIQREIERTHFSQAAVGARDAQPLQLGLSAPGLATNALSAQQQSEEARTLEAMDWDAVPAEQSYTDAARAYAGRQRLELELLSVAALAEAAQDLAALNQAEGRVETLRDIESEHRGNVPRSTTLAEEQRTDLAAGIAADLRQQFQESNSRAIHAADAAQRRRIGLNNMLRGRAPR